MKTFIATTMVVLAASVFFCQSAAADGAMANVPDAMALDAAHDAAAAQSTMPAHDAATASDSIVQLSAERTGSQLAASSVLMQLREVLGAREDDMQKIVNGELVSNDNSGGADLTAYVPVGSAIAETLRAAPTGKNGFALASVTLVPYPDSWTHMSARERMLALYNALGRISTQKGITYISRRAGYKPKELFTQSHYIASESKNAQVLADITAAAVPKTEVRYVFQEDTSFGENTYRHTYTNSANEIFVEITNCTPMKYHGVTCLKKEEMRMCISLYPVQEGVLVSSAAIVTGHKTTVTVVFVKVDLADSFKRRTDALHAWFKKQVEE